MAKWNFDVAHSGASFSARHMMLTTVRGAINISAGVLDFDPANPTNGSVEVTLDATSLNTGVEARDGHLKSPDFLDVANFPTITFKSTKVEMTGENTANITGDLTIRGNTRPVVIKAEYLGAGKDAYGKEKVGFIGSTRINREDWGLTWNVLLETGGVLVGKEITIELDVQAEKVVESVAATA
ncbi:MAG: YceI family protein [Anaerolineae bacterium]